MQLNIFVKGYKYFMRTRESLPQDTRNILGTNNIFDLKKEKEKKRETKCY